jgi:hypothetical protein
MTRRIRQYLAWLLLALMLAGAGLAVARAEPADRAPYYVPFEPIIVPVFIDSRSSGLLSVQIQLEATSNAERAAIEAQRPRLIDAYTNALIRHARIHVDPLATVDVDAIAAAVAGATTATLDGVAPRVLIVEAMAQAA